MTTVAEPSRRSRDVRRRPGRRPTASTPATGKAGARPDATSNPAGRRWRSFPLRGRAATVALVAVCAVALVAGGLGLTRTSLFAVRAEVTGLSHLSRDEVLEAAGITTASRYSDVDDERARAGVAGLAWVERVSISSSLPKRVRIEVTERVPAGTAPCPSGAVGCQVVVDRTGRVLGEAGGQYNVPKLEQVANIPPTGHWLGGADHEVAVAAGLVPPKLRDNAVSVGRDGPDLVLRLKPLAARAKQAPRRTVATTTASGPPADVTVVRLGGADALSDKMAAAAAVLGADGGPDVTQVDVRTPAYPVLARTAAPSNPPGTTPSPSRSADARSGSVSKPGLTRTNAPNSVSTSRKG